MKIILFVLTFMFIGCQIDTNNDHSAKLICNTSPQGANILIDGYETGYITPFVVDTLWTGIHNIQFEKKGYYPKGHTFRVRDWYEIHFDDTLAKR